MAGKRFFRRAVRQFVLVLILVATALVAGVVADRKYLLDLVPPQGVPASAQSDFGLMGEAWNLIDRHYVDRKAIKPRRMTYGAIAGMVDSLGDIGHSTFLTPEMVEQDQDMSSGEFAGVGAEIQMKDHHVVIVAPMDGSPAKKAGLRAGDIIVRVNGKDVGGDSLTQVVNKIRGPAGTKVKLGVRHKGSEKVSEITVTRAEIPLVSVHWAMLPGTHIAHVRISMFSKGTAKALAKALDAAQQQGAEGLILDLRSDPGGLLSEAVEVASRFLKGGNVLLVKDASGNTKPVPVLDEPQRCSLPMVVLINGGTASAAEIVSGALRDQQRAKLVGQTTFGTGTVLNRFMLSDGSALMLAVEEWLTPDGKVIWHKGITPDVKVALGSDVEPLLPEEEKDLSASALKQSKDAQLMKALHMLQGPQQTQAAVIGQ